MRTRLRARLALALTAIGLSAESAWAHGEGSWSDIFNGIIASFDGPQAGACVSCHASGGGPQAGGMQPAFDEDSWYSALVNAKAANGPATSAGKLRVHKFQPWNSFLVDKLTGHLKGGEGGPMPCTWTGSGCSPLAVPYVFTCPGGVDKIVTWILGGAKRAGYGGDGLPEDRTPGAVLCDLDQPPFVGLPPPSSGTGLQASGAFDTVVYPSREKELVRAVALGNESELFVGRIEIRATAGTEWVSVTRRDDGAPLVVARGERLDVELPPGVAVRLGPHEQIEIRQVIRNDYWVRPATAGGLYRNETVGTAVVNLHTVDPATVTATAVPFLEDTATQTLWVPPRSAGTEGGAWTSPGARGALVGLWTDRRVLAAVLTDGAGVPIGEVRGVGQPGPLTNGYVAVGGAPAVSYRCVHANGLHDNFNADVSNSLKGTETTSGTLGRLTGRPQRYGCAEAVVPILNLALAPGMPGLAGSGPAADCVRSNSPSTNDCSGIGPEACVPANLVGGMGVEDGRCTLIGLVW